MTLSGGEPLAQWRFARSSRARLRRANVSVALETTGLAPWDALAAVLEFVDLVLFDLKPIDDAAHRTATGVGNALSLANLRRLAGERDAVRPPALPLVPGHNLDARHLRRPASWPPSLARARST